MKYKLLIILTLLTIIPSIAQDINKIVFISQGFDEPPTKQGKPLLTVEYTKNDSGNFAATHYLENKKKRKLETPIIIDEERVTLFKDWRIKGLKTFKLSDFGLNDEIVRERARNNKLKTSFGLPESLLIQTDSFSYCQNWKMTRSITTGGYQLAIEIIYTNRETDKFVFGSNDLGMGQFDLKGYLYSFLLLTDKIPNQVHQYDYFTLNNFVDIVLAYQKTVECEGFYYNEFVDMNPTRTSAENRTMTDWDFVKYLKEREKIN